MRGLLLIQVIIALGFAILPTDPEGAPTTFIGRLHLIDFYLYALTMPLTLIVLSLVMRRDPRWQRGVRPTLLASGLVVVSAALVPATLDGPLTPWLGLLERLYIAVPSIWQVAVGVAAWRLATTSIAPSSARPHGG